MAAGTMLSFITCGDRQVQGPGQSCLASQILEAHGTMIGMMVEALGKMWHLKWCEGKSIPKSPTKGFDPEMTMYGKRLIQSVRQTEHERHDDQPLNLEY